MSHDHSAISYWYLAPEILRLFGELFPSFRRDRTGSLRHIGCINERELMSVGFNGIGERIYTVLVIL